MKRIALALLLCSSAWAGDLLTNADVLRLVRAGISADVIVTKIEQSPASFDTSTDALVALKNAGAPDTVLKTMLLKQAPPPPAPAPQTPPAASDRDHCAAVSLYTNGTNGWEWAPSSICVDAKGVWIDEQLIPTPDIKAQCLTKPVPFPFGDGSQELWLATSKETFKVRTKGDALKTLSAEIGHVSGSVTHGDCNSPSVRSRFPAAGK